jgi:hypothetical protein
LQVTEQINDAISSYRKAFPVGVASSELLQLLKMFNYYPVVLSCLFGPYFVFVTAKLLFLVPVTEHMSFFLRILIPENDGSIWRCSGLPGEDVAAPEAVDSQSSPPIAEARRYAL